MMTLLIGAIGAVLFIGGFETVVELVWRGFAWMCGFNEREEA